MKNCGRWCCGLVMLVSSLAWADRIWVNGKQWDDRYGEPKDLTGYLEYRDGNKVTSRYEMVHGEKEGPYVHFDSGGKPDEVGTYRHGKVDGVRRRYRDGVLEAEQSYVEGNLVGVQKEYRDGVLSRVYLTEVEGRRATTRVLADMQFNKEGQLTQLRCGQKPIGKRDAEWCGLNGKQSTVTLYTAEGAASRSEQYLWGKQHGTARKFNVRTGKVMQEEQYKDGLRDGTSKRFDPETGNVLREEHYDSGKLLKDGEKHFDKEGTLLAKTDCDDKRTRCTESHFFENGGQPQSVAVWKDGKISSRKEYYQNGKVREDLSKEGDRFKIDEFSDTGQLVSKGTYIEAKDWFWRPFVPDGVVERYNDDGSLWRRESYQAGRRQGHAVTHWNEEGHKVREESEWDKDAMKSQKLYVDDALTDEFEYFPDGSLKDHREVAKSPLLKL